MSVDIPLSGINREHESLMHRSRMVAKIALMLLLLLIGHDGVMAMNPHDVDNAHAVHGMHHGALSDDQPDQVSKQCADPFGRMQSSNPVPGPSAQCDLPLFQSLISTPDAVIRSASEDLRAIDSTIIRVLWQVFLN